MYNGDVLHFLATSAPIANNWIDTPIGKWLRAILAVIGGVIVVVAIIKAIGAFVTGKMGQGVKVIVGSAVIAAFMFYPTLITDVIKLLGGVVEKVIGTADELDPESGAGGGGAPAS